VTGRDVTSTTSGPSSLDPDLWSGSTILHRISTHFNNQTIPVACLELTESSKTVLVSALVQISSTFGKSSSCQSTQPLPPICFSSRGHQKIQLFGYCFPNVLPNVATWLSMHCTHLDDPGRSQLGAGIQKVRWRSC